MNKTNNSDDTNLSYNICSFNANPHSFLTLLTDDRFAPEMLVLTETWFRINPTDDINGYNAYHSVRSENRSGGVSVYARQNFGYELVEDMCGMNDTIERLHGVREKIIRFLLN